MSIHQHFHTLSPVTIEKKNKLEKKEFSFDLKSSRHVQATLPTCLFNEVIIFELMGDDIKIERERVWKITTNSPWSHSPLP